MIARASPTLSSGEASPAAQAAWCKHPGSMPQLSGELQGSLQLWARPCLRGLARPCLAGEWNNPRHRAMSQGQEGMWAGFVWAMQGCSTVGARPLPEQIKGLGW